MLHTLIYFLRSTKVGVALMPLFSYLAFALLIFISFFLTETILFALQQISPVKEGVFAESKEGWDCKYRMGMYDPSFRSTRSDANQPAASSSHGSRVGCLGRVR